MIEALYNVVVVKPVEVEETMYGNIVVPDLGNEVLAKIKKSVNVEEILEETELTEEDKKALS